VADFDINELCSRADVTPRTVHFYIQQGLLPPAGSTGPGARYGEGHLSRIRLVRLLQKQHLPLAEIARRMKGLSDEQVTALIAETKQKRTEPRGTALDYIRSVLAEPGSARHSTDERAIASRPRFSSAPFASVKLQTTASAAPERSQWERFTLADGIELSVRRPMSRVEQRQFEKLMAAARKIFSDTEGEPEQ
jgi:DNA-binding transcriptional MerR regulator